MDRNIFSGLALVASLISVFIALDKNRELDVLIATSDAETRRYAIKQNPSREEQKKQLMLIGCLDALVMLNKYDAFNQQRCRIIQGVE